MEKKRSFILCIISLVVIIPARGSDIDADEQVICFPTHAVRTNTGWDAPIHAWVFEPEPDSAWRDAAAGRFIENLDVERGEPGHSRGVERARWFILDNERGQALRLRFDLDPPRVFALDETEPNGHVHDSVTLPPDAGRDGDWLSYHIVLGSDDPREMKGRVQLLGPTGLSVVSDIDDTVKISQVGDLQALLRRTLVAEHEAVPGMAAAYAQWAKRGAVFHYVTASPHQVYPHLRPFMDQAGFPPGAWTMKHVRLKDDTLLDLHADPFAYKLKTIEPILRRHPRRRFVLVGDSGEKDLEAYGELARRYPEQIAKIFIRVAGVRPDEARLAAAMKDVPSDRWRLFEDGGDLEDEVLPFAPQ